MIKLATPGDLQALRAFARTMIWAFPLFFAGILPWLFGYRFPWWPFWVSATLLVLYFVAPRGLYYPYRAWMAIALLLGWINTRIILSFCFFFLILPMGVVLRSFNILQYRSRPNAEVTTYFVERTEPLDDQNLEHPY